MGAEPQKPPQRTKGLSLGVRALLLLATLNLLAFGTAGALLVRQLGAQQDAQALGLYADFLRTLRGSIRPDRDVNVASILSWPGWTEVEDALLVDARLEATAQGGLAPQGIVLNPVGRLGRPLRTADSEIYVALGAAVEYGTESEVSGGRVVPIAVQGKNWGACWFRLPKQSRMGALVRSLAPGFLVSTLLLIGATFLGLKRLVLEPVQALHLAARRLEGGDLGARAELSGGGGELVELGATFDRMAVRMQGFNQELERRVDEATRQAKEAERAAQFQRRLAAMGELAAGIAHEINNPLGGLTNAVRALQTKELDPERRVRYLFLLSDGLERIRQIVQKVLRVAPRETEPKPVDLVGVVQDALFLVAHRAASAGVTLEASVGDQPLPLDPEPQPALREATRILGAANELAQALLNLLSNALDSLEAGVGAAHREPKCVRVRLEVLPKEVRVSVEDNGPGAHPEDLGRARDLFFSTKEVGRGTGLGLSIVHAIAQNHHGRLELESEPGAGFCARLILPRFGSQDPAPAP